MSEDWGELETLPERKGSKSKFFCLGCGCLLPVLVLIGIATKIYFFIQTGRDAETQWERLAELVPYDSRPQGWRMEFGCRVGLLWDLEFYVLQREGQADGETDIVTIMQPGEPMDDFFDPGEEGVAPWNPQQADEPVSTVSIQGRELRVALVAPETKGGESFFWGADPEEGEFEGPVLALDLTPEGAEFDVVLYWATEGEEAVELDELEEFLNHFRIGPE